MKIQVQGKERASSDQPAPVQPRQGAWDGIVPPGLGAGTKYRILFVTSGTRTAQSHDIETYNAFVQNQANNATGDPFNHPDGTNITFKVLGSTADVDARCNTQTHARASDCGGAATLDDALIYYYQGGFSYQDGRVADNYADLYDGSWGTQRPRDQNGRELDGDVWVHTGTSSDGVEKTHAHGTRALGGDHGDGDSTSAMGKPETSGEELDSGWAHLTRTR